MSDNDSIRLVLEQEGPYAFRIEFDGTSLEALHTDEPAPLGAGAGPNPSALLLAGVATLFLLFAGIEMPPPPGRSAGYPLLLGFSPLLYGAATLVVIVLAAGAAGLVSSRAARKPVTEALAHV